MRTSHFAVALIGATLMLACDSVTKPVPPPAPPPANPPPPPPPPPPQPPPPPPAPGALGISIVSRDLQSGTVGARLPQPLVVKVTRGGSAPEKGQALTFRVAAGGGSLVASTDTTDAEGLVRKEWTLGIHAGDLQKLEVKAVDHVTGAQIPADTLSATALAAAPATLTVAAGQDVQGDAGDPVDVSPAVQLKDRFGNPTPEVKVTFAVTSGNGSVSGGDAVTNAQGVATVGSWVIGTQRGEHTLTATASGSGISGNPASFKYSFCDCWSAVAPLSLARAGLAATEFNGKLF